MNPTAWFSLKSFHACEQAPPPEQRTGNTTVVERFVDGKWIEVVVELRSEAA